MHVSQLPAARELGPVTLPTKPQPPSRHHRTLGSPTHAAPGQAMGLQRTRTQPHNDKAATGDNRVGRAAHPGGRSRRTTGEPAR